MKPTIQPTLVVDSREQDPLTFRTFPCIRGTLTSGDYSIAGATELFAVERKSIPDLVTSVTSERDRFERELHRLRGYRFARLLIVGSQAAFEARYNVPVVWSPTPDAAALQIEAWAFWFSREILKAAQEIQAAAVAEPISQS